MPEFVDENALQPVDAARRAQEDRLGWEIMDYAKQTLTVELRFLDVALNRLQPFLLPQQCMATDGNALGFDPRFVLQCYQAEPSRMARTYLHIVLHCVFQHIYEAVHMNRTLWDAACDVAVEYVIDGLNVPAVRCEGEDRRRQEFEVLERELGQVTAEKIYCYYRDLPRTQEQLEELGRLFHADDHFPWYRPEPLYSDERRAGGNQGDRQSGDRENGKQTEGSGGESQKDPQEHPMQGPPDSDPQEEWQEIAHRMQSELEASLHDRGTWGGSMKQTLKSVRRERYDYASFLKRFSVLGEHMKLNPDEFDTIFYTYGLSRYGNLPLIEPLEYSEDRHVREFVIAIDTSGSVRGPLVQTFVQKTYNILKSTESFASRVNVHIIQCDQEIREHKKITTLQAFDGYMRSMELKGFGGTDFRPVFEYVDDLIKQKEFRQLRGLIYFTDGRGKYPRKKPPYETAFVFLDGADNNTRIPPWGIQMTLQKEEIEQL